MENVLGKEGVAFEVPALNLVARAAEGSMRDALSLLDQAIAHGAGKVEEASVREMLGVVDRAYLFSLLKALSAGNGPALLSEADRIASRSLSFDSALQELATLLHRVALAQTVPDALQEDEPERDTLFELAKGFSEEDVQLLYQIAIHGRRDLGLAPDEFAGFTMTLMRMLAFLPVVPGAPASTGGRETPRPAAKPVASTSAPAAASRPMPGTPASSAQSPAAATYVAPRAAPRVAPLVTQVAPEVRAGGPIDQELADWPSLVGKIKVGGMARMLADNCEFRKLEGDVLELAVPEAHKHLLEKAYTDKLQAALEEFFGRRIRLKITPGGGGKTPAEIENQERQAKLAKAIESIDTDPFVRELVENFDARVNDSTIKPVQ